MDNDVVFILALVDGVLVGAWVGAWLGMRVADWYGRWLAWRDARRRDPVLWDGLDE